MMEELFGNPVFQVLLIIDMVVIPFALSIIAVELMYIRHINDK